MKDRHTRASKFLSLVLRHRPEKVGLALEREGWVSVSRLLEALGAHGLRLTPEELRELVRANDKQRFSFSPDGLSVGGRYGKPVVLRIASGAMHSDGHRFFRSANGVWLTEHVPTRYIAFGDDDRR